ncbi:PAS domain S-box protein [Arcticibacter pallidicorallinus]|nr:PAS domain S-box protein [Arcticibacter pallidicorallinus]
MHIQSTIVETFLEIVLVTVTSLSLYHAFKKHRRSQLHYANEYRNIFKDSPLPIWIYDRNTLIFMEVNKAAEDHYGYTRKEFLGMTILDIRDEKMHLKTRISAGQMPAEAYKSSGFWEHIKRNGETITVHITSTKIRFRDKECVMVIAQDITIQVIQERKLKELYAVEQENKKLLELHILQLNETLEEKRRLAEVIDRINNLAIITDSIGRIIWVNKAFVKHTGYELKEIEGKNPHFLHGPKTDPSTHAEMMESLKQDKFKNFEILNYTKEGEEYWVDMSFSPIYDRNNQIIRYISIQNIITERKAIDEKIREQNKMLRKIAWTNSHAFRKPVASIISLVDISNDMNQPQEIQEIHKLIGACAKELDTITKDIAKKIRN